MLFVSLLWLNVDCRSIINFQVRVDIILNVMLTVAVALLPCSFIPFTLLWIYDKFLWCTEPFWQCVEVIGVVRLVMELSEMVREDNRQGVAKVWTILYAINSFILSLKCSHRNFAF